MLSIHSSEQGMPHLLTTITLRFPTSFLLVLLINQHTINHHTLAILHHHTLAILHHHTLATLHHYTMPTLHQATLHHHTLATLSQDINTLLSMFATIETHHPPSSHLLMVHNTAASYHASTLELKYKNQVAKVISVALHLCFHAKFWGKHRNALFTGWWWSLALRMDMLDFVSLPTKVSHTPMFLFLYRCSNLLVS